MKLKRWVGFVVVYKSRSWVVVILIKVLVVLNIILGGVGGNYLVIGYVIIYISILEVNYYNIGGSVLVWFLI